MSTIGLSKVLGGFFFALNFVRVDLNRHLGMTVLLSSSKFWRNLKINELKLVLNILSF